MEGPLDYASIQIFPNKNRYEAFVYKGKQSEKVAAGQLEHLLPHISAMNDLYDKGCDASFDLKLAENLHGAEWFSKATVERFMHIVSSPDFVNDVNTIMGEMFQLENSKKIHISIYEKPEVNDPSSQTSKIEFLQAMDLRLTVLRSKLAETVNKAVGGTCSIKDMAYLAKFSQHFGATDIEHSMCKFIALNQKSEDIGPLYNETARGLTNDGAKRAVKNLPISKPLLSDAPAKAAQAEKRSLTEREESSNSSHEDQTYAERSRSLIGSATPRRSASPKRRVPIGRAGPHKAAALINKRLSFPPEQPHKKEFEVRRISVQNAISRFERKLGDETTGIQQRKSLTNVSISTNKFVLRRWSTNSGMRESRVRGQPEIFPEDAVSVSSNVVAHVEIPKNSEREVVSDFFPETHNNIEITDCDAKSEWQENVGSSYTVDNQEETDPIVKEEIVDKLAASKEWNKQRQAELNHILTKMAESKPVRLGRSLSSRKQNITFGQRGGCYDHYRAKRDAKLSRQRSGKRLEKQAHFQEMQQLLEKKKAEMLSKTESAIKKNSARLPQKSLRNSTQPANSPKETSVMKKTSFKTKTSPLPATCKTWSATPSTRDAATPLTKSHSGISFSRTTPTQRKPMSTSAIPQPRSQREKSQQQSRNGKETPTSNVQCLKSTNGKRQTVILTRSKAIKTNIPTSSGESSGTSKIGFGNKGTNKNSVVPLESKPFQCKGTRTGTENLNKKKNPPKLDKPLRDSEDLIEYGKGELVVNASDLVSQHSDMDQNASTEQEYQINNHLQLDETENTATNEESTISPSVWVETEEDLDLPKQFQHAFPSRIPAVGFTTPRVYHSLPQMLQEEISEPETCKQGNAENPPATIYQRDAPKGLKRLLKFAWNSKGDAGSSGRSSPSVFSAEDDADEFKNSNKKNADNLPRKGALSAKSYGEPKCPVHNGYERNLDDGNGSHKMQKRHSDASSTTRGSRSFFSLSAYRGNKPSESRFH
ncbi:unnamed protein product [Lupinus luteus]|uniref:COP1-interacting protein 7 n=1 Tax=Lupinus luteus TaxID=3873 RepID=A0AAV1Y0Z5_LUPLU